MSVVAAAHNYDVPMIVGETVGAGVDAASDAQHWKGTIAGGAQANSLASSLAASRLVACAQVSADGTVAVKTVHAAIPLVQKAVQTAVGAADAPPIQWVPIVGNEDYLKWVTEETKVEACGES